VEKHMHKVCSNIRLLIGPSQALHPSLAIHTKIITSTNSSNGSSSSTPEHPSRTSRSLQAISSTTRSLKAIPKHQRREQQQGNGTLPVVGSSPQQSCWPGTGLPVVRHSGGSQGTGLHQLLPACLCQNTILPACDLPNWIRQPGLCSLPASARSLPTSYANLVCQYLPLVFCSLLWQVSQLLRRKFLVAALSMEQLSKAKMHLAEAARLARRSGAHPGGAPGECPFLGWIALELPLLFLRQGPTRPPCWHGKRGTTQ